MQDHTPHKHEQVKPHEKPDIPGHVQPDDENDDDLTLPAPEVTPNAEPLPGDGGDSGDNGPPPPPPVKK